MKIFKDQWAGNQWPSIEFSPPDASYLKPIVRFVQDTYHIEIRPNWVIATGVYFDFELLGSKVCLDLDDFTLSMAFENVDVRDKVFEDLQVLVDEYSDSE